MPRKVRSPDTDPRPTGEAAAEVVPHTHDLQTLRAACEHCRACPLGALATQSVFGEGALGAEIVLVGEQPGDMEDRAGRPFVGPAGRVLDRALEAAGISRQRVYVTNAVKHFSYRPLGKKRLHARPVWSNVVACRPWLRAELAAIRPSLVICLGATAAQTLLGKTASVSKLRGQVARSELAALVVPTIHPSAVLRMPDASAREAAFAGLVDDLRFAAEQLARTKRGRDPT